MTNKHTPKIEGKHILLKVGKKYDARTLNYAIKKALLGEDLNGEDRLALINLKVQLAFHFERDKEENE